MTWISSLRSSLTSLSSRRCHYLLALRHSSSSTLSTSSTSPPNASSVDPSSSLHPSTSESESNDSLNVDISLFSPLLDPHPSECGPNWAVYFGSKPPYEPLPEKLVRQSMGADMDMQQTIEALPPYSLTTKEIRDLYKFTLVVKRVVCQTGKGKPSSLYMGVVVGNGNGLVGFGEGKADSASVAGPRALKNAIRNMAPVNLYEGRTIHSEMRAKFHATEIVMRPRPPGFGLRVNPFLHQVAKAAGITDLSAKVTRNNNPMNVIKLSLMMLQTGSAPTGMGDGFGGKGRRMEKGIGMRTGEELALMRGRRMEFVGPDDF